ncbi:MAG: aspartate/glutamate racemase family protein [Burkholderiaceae bacterium]|nr:aspartate/glutamate racemase family protein [Burkholderiaceae bacterium]
MTNAAYRPVLGVIVPPADGAVPPELPALYADRIRVVGRGLAIPGISMAGFDTVIDRVAQLSRELAADGATAIALMGTSLSFYRGGDWNEQITHTMRAAGRLPATTMSDAIVAALHAVHGKRLAVATAYTDEMNCRLHEFLEARGFEVASLVALGLSAVEQVHAVHPHELEALGERAVREAKNADAVLISCGGLRTLDVTMPLESRTGLPVVSSAVAGAWAAVRLLGDSGCAQGYGRLLAQSPERGSLSS